MSAPRPPSILYRSLLLAGLAALGGCAAPFAGRPLLPDISSLPPTPAASAPTRAPEAAIGGAKSKAYLYPGSGTLVQAPPTRPMAQAAPGGTTLNFEGADIREVAHVVLGDQLKLNYMVDPRVQGQISVRTAAPLSNDALLAALDSALRMNGAALVYDKYANMYKVLPVADALKSSIDPQLAGPEMPLQPGYGVVAVPLKYIGAEEMAKILQPLTPTGGIVRVDPTRNLLIVAGGSDELRHLLDTVDMFDVDWMSGMSVGIVKLANMDVKNAEPAVEKLFGAKSNSPLAGLVRVIPLEQLDAFMLVTAQPAYLNQARTWIERIDKAGYGGTQLFVYPVRNGSAVKLAAVLNALYSNKAAAESSSEAPSTAPGTAATSLFSNSSSGATGSTGSIGSTSNTLGSTGSSSGASAGLGSGLTLPTQASSATGSGGSPVTTGGDSNVTLRSAGGVKIIADKDNNTLLILATTTEFDKIQAALQRLDTAPRQVLIEVTIAQVTLTRNLQYGLQWFFNSHGGTLNGQAISSMTSAGIAVPPSTSSLPGGLSLYKLGSSGDIRVLFNALANDSDLKILSTPQLMVTDNQTAQIQVGDQVPTISATQTGTGAAAGTITNSITYVDTGVMLSVTPRINSGGLVSMDIAQQVSSASNTTTSAIDSPTISQRTIQTHVAVQSGKTLVMGGLIQDQSGGGSTGLPWLSEIPVLGGLFGQQTKNDQRTELVVLITPRVISDAQDASAVTREYRSRVAALRTQIEGTKPPKASQPTLPTR